jgi:hypothetical protein
MAFSVVFLNSLSKQIIFSKKPIIKTSGAASNGGSLVSIAGNTLCFKDSLFERDRELFYRVLRRIFGPKRDETTGEWRRLHKEELNDLYLSPNIIRVIIWRIMRWAGHVARLGEKRGAYRILVGRPEGRRSLGRPRRKWEDNIKIDPQEVGWGMDWMDLAQDRDRWRALVNAVMNLRVP